MKRGFFSLRVVSIAAAVTLGAGLVAAGAAASGHAAPARATSGRSASALAAPARTQSTGRANAASAARPSRAALAAMAELARALADRTGAGSDLASPSGGQIGPAGTGQAFAGGGRIGAPGMDLGLSGAAGLAEIGAGLADVAPGAITGVVLGARGLPLTGACVTARGPSGIASGMTKADGRFVISGLAPGSYSLSYRACADPARYFPAWYATPPAGGGFSEFISGQGMGAPALAGPDSASPTAGAPGSATAGLAGPVGADLVTVSPDRLTPAPPATLVAVAPGGRFPSPGAAATTTAGQAGTRQGVISGTVRNVSGKRLAGVCVYAEGGANGTAIGAMSATNRRGGYSLPLPPFPYQVQFEVGCGNDGNYAPQWWDHASLATKATTIHLRAGQHVTGIDGDLGRGARITGVVRFRSAVGRPLAGICVQADGRGAAAQTFGFARTGRDGAFTMHGLATGSYTLVFGPGCDNNGNYLETRYPRAVATTAGRTTAGIVGVLQPGGQITGTVTGAGGRPLSGVCVTAATPAGMMNGAVTGADGAYRVTRLTTGRYQVSYSGGCGSAGSLAPLWYHQRTTWAAADLVPVIAGQATAGIDADMSPGATISGNVTGPSGRAQSGICVGITAPSITNRLGTDYVLALGVSSGGSYRVRNLAPASYQVFFVPGCGNGRPQPLSEGWFRSAPDSQRASLVSASSPTVVRNVNAALRPAGAISGSVRTTSGRAVQGACVTAVNRATGAQSQTLIFGGYYRIRGLAPGVYTVGFSACGNANYADQWYRGQVRPGTATPVRVAAYQVTSGIDARLGPGGMITGVVRSAISRQPIPRVCILAYDLATQSFGFAITNRQGRYGIWGLDSARYRVEAFLCRQGGSDLAGQLLPSPVAVTASGTVRVDISLHPGGDIAGAVWSLAPARERAAGICELIEPVTGDGAAQIITTGRGGGYLTTGLAAGTYDVAFADDCRFGPDELAPQWYDGQSTQAHATPVRVRADQIRTGIDALLAWDGSISGTVTGPGGAALGGICATAVPLGPASDPFALANPVTVAVASGGGYRITGLVPGRYDVKFDSGCGSPAGYRTQWYDGASSQQGASPVAVSAAADTPGIDAAMQPVP